MLLEFLAVSLAASQPEVHPDNYATSRMEAQAVLGELRYQHGDLTGAYETFHDSLEASTGQKAPQAHVVAHDLYRTAELAIRRGDLGKGKRNLEILVSRYPDTDWADKAERLLAALERGERGAEDDVSVAPLGEATPEGRLRRLQAALRGGAWNDALGWSDDFLQRHPDHKSADEVRLARAVLRLREKDAAGALSDLRTKDPALRGRAAYLAGAALLEANRAQDVLRAVPAADPSKTWDRWLSLAQVWRGAALERLGRAAEAELAYARVAAMQESSPARSYAIAGLAAFRDRAGRLDEAAALLRRAGAEAARFGQDELAAMCRLSEAHVLYRQRRLDDAADAYGAFALSHPRHPQRTSALFHRGLALKKLGRPREALKAFSALVKLHSDSVYARDAHLQLGQIYAAEGDSEKAEEHYGALGGAEALLLSAQVHYNAKRWTEALALYWRYLETQTAGKRHEEVADLVLAASLASGEGVDKALEKFGSRPVAAQLRWTLGRRAFSGGDAKGAEEHLTRLLADFPRTPHRTEARLMLAETMMKLSRPIEAASLYREFLAAAPKHKEARRSRFRLGAALHEAGRHREAADAFLRVGGKDEMAADAALNHALAVSKAGDKKGVLASYESFLRLFPKHSKAPGIWFEVAELRESLGRTAQAIEAYGKAPLSRRAEALFAAGRCQEKLGKKDSAMKTYARLRDLRPENDLHRLGGLLRLGLMQELDAPLKAMRLYGEVMKHSPRSSANFETARKRLGEMTRDGSLVTK